MKNIKLTQNDQTSYEEVTLVDQKWLEEHGHGSRATIWRKRKEGRFPEPNVDGKWTIKQIREHIEELTETVAA